MDIIERPDPGTCGNCRRPMAGAAQRFCPDCGQPTPTRRIDWVFLGHELEHGFLHMDRGFLYTARQLFQRPGHFIREYLQGQRHGHVKPLLMLVMTAALVSLLGLLLLGGNVLGGVLEITTSASVGVEQAGGQAGELAGERARVVTGIDGERLAASFIAVREWINRHLTVVALLLIPLQALSFMWGFRRFRTINYPEWLVITTFLAAQTFLIWSLAVPLQRLWPQLQSVAMAVAVLANMLSLVQLFRGYPKWKAFLRALLGFGWFYVFNTFIVLGVSAVLVLTSLQ